LEVPVCLAAKAILDQKARQQVLKKEALCLVEQ